MPKAGRSPASSGRRGDHSPCGPLLKRVLGTGRPDRRDGDRGPVSLNPSADLTRETMISGRVVEQGTVVREARVVEGTWESGIRTFLGLREKKSDEKWGR
jgi:hypothetical protein